MGHAMVKTVKLMSKTTLHKRATKLTENMKHLEGNSYALK